ncbi:hypothetical protein OF83DRAFT_166388 [Amylostereum chailletii]|nr:hypothetical protein OF83DRAFT_166388 [Amylostereum chailletii]
MIEVVQVLNWSMAPTSLQLAASVSWTRVNLPGFVAESIIFGIYNLLIVQSNYILLRKKTRSRSVYVLLAATNYMYICSAVYWALDFYPFLVILGSPSEHAIESARESFERGVVSALCLGSNILCNDAVALWRAWILWSGNKFVAASCCCAFFATLVVSMVSFLEIVLPSPDSALTVGDVYVFDRGVWSAVMFSLSSATNLWATTLIAYKAWQYRRDISMHLRQGGRRSKVENVLALLIESGMLYLCMLVVYTAASSLMTPRALLQPIFSIIMADILPQLAGLYPTIIVVLVCLQKTHCDRQFTYADVEVAGAREVGLPMQEMSTSASRQSSTTRSESISIIGRMDDSQSNFERSLEDVEVKSEVL